METNLKFTLKTLSTIIIYKIIFLSFFTCFLLTGHLANGQGNITKEDVKELKKTLPGILIIKPDYFEGHIVVKTKEIAGFGITRMGTFKEPALTHVFYFLLKKGDDGKFYTPCLRYKPTWISPAWLFMDKISILCAKSNSETREGVGNKYETIIDDPKMNRVAGIGNIVEYYDIVAPKSIIDWLVDVRDNRSFSRIRVYGSEGSYDKVVRASDLEEHAAAILNAYSMFAVR